MSATRIESWGMLHEAHARVHRPSSREELEFLLADLAGSKTRYALRGGGNSYGDAPLLDGGVILDLQGLDRILDWNPETGIAHLEPGVTLEKLWRHVLPDGYWPAVTSGTMKVTIGGACAFDIHGKNHFRNGSFRDHVLGFDLVTPRGETRYCSPDADPELHDAALGSGGMFGVISRVELRLERVHSGRVEVRPIVVDSFGELVDVFERESASGRASYLVGWHDVLAPGKARGRGLVHVGRHLDRDEDESGERFRDPKLQDLPPRIFGLWPMAWVWPLLWLAMNPPGMRLINALKFMSGRRNAKKGAHLQPLAQFHYLLDHVPGWKKAYLPGGLIQFQSFLPTAKAAEVFDRTVATCHRHGFPPYLCVTKKHRASQGILPYALDGYSQALDIRIRPGRMEAAQRMCRELEEIVLAAGGRLYLAKDAMLGPAAYRASVGEEAIERFRALKRELDPQNLLVSDQALRLDLVD